MNGSINAIMVGCLSWVILFPLPNQAASLRLNEIMARNEAAVTDSSGRYLDWIEIANSSPIAVSLAGLRLGTDPTNTWVFPVNVSIPANGFRVIWCDNSRPASVNSEPDLNCALTLPVEGSSVYLLDAASQVIDVVTYAGQITDLSIGRVNDVWRLLSSSTPGSANAAVMVLGSSANLRINEWMADPDTGSDWFELYNLGPLPVDLSGLFLSNDPAKSAQTKFTIPNLCFVGGQSWIKWIADNKPAAGPDHVNFKLPASGGSILLYSLDTNLVDRVDYSQQQLGVSEGRLPDGGANIVRFETTPTPGEDNYLPLTNVIINEVLAHTDPPLEDAIELYNPNSTNIDLSGWFVSNKPDDLKRYRFPEGSVIPANGYLVIYEYQFINPTHFTLNSAHGDRVYLSTGDALGNLTGYRTKTPFRSSANGISFGRFLTSTGTEFVPLSQLTLGTSITAADPPSQLSVFRTGKGAPNAYPLVGPLVITEIMYHPPTWDGTNDNTLGEFIELQNLTSQSLPLYDPVYPTNTWKIEGGIRFTFPRNLIMAPNSYWLVVSFNPQTNLLALAEFSAHYTLPSNTVFLGPYAGKLQNSGDTIEIYKPDPVQQPPHPDAGYVPYILVERIKFKDTYPWRPEADGGGASLQRLHPSLFANEPTNWTAQLPTPGGGDTDQDGMPDVWETANGLNPLNPSDAAEDPDQDGLSNLREYWAGTNPRQSQSTLKLTIRASTNHLISIQFGAQPAKSYAVETTTNIANGIWSAYTNLAASPTNAWIELLEDSVSRQEPRFFRLRIPQSNLP